MIKNKKKGFSMIELIIIIAVLGVLTAIVLQQSHGMRESSRLNTESTSLATLTTVIQSTFNSQLTYEGLTNHVILRTTNFPESMVSPISDAIKTSWNDDAVSVESVDGADAYQGQDHSSFRMIYEHIPPTVCVEFASRNFLAFYRMDVNGVMIHSEDPSNIKPYSLADVLASCNDSSDSIITFYSR